MSAFYGCVVVGPPGAGKSTMCAGLCRYMALARRPVALVNLDPACEGEGLAEFEIDVRDMRNPTAVLKKIQGAIDQHVLERN